MDLGGVDLLEGAHHMHAPEALTLEPSQRLLQLRALLTDDVGTESPVGTRPVALLADRLRRVEHDRDGKQVVLLSELNQRPASLALHVGRIDDREPGLGQPPAGNELQDRECVLRCALVVLVVGHQAAAEIRRDHLGRREALARERALTRARGTDQHDKAGIRKLEPHRLNTAICVGGPTSGSSGPTGRWRTA